jgi:hypothetical protein
MNFEKKRKRQNGRQRRNESKYWILFDESDYLWAEAGDKNYRSLLNWKTVSFEEFARDYPHPEVL